MNLLILTASNMNGIENMETVKFTFIIASLCIFSFVYMLFINNMMKMITTSISWKIGFAECIIPGKIKDLKIYIYMFKQV